MVLTMDMEVIDAFPGECVVEVLDVAVPGARLGIYNIGRRSGVALGPSQPDGRHPTVDFLYNR